MKTPNNSLRWITLIIILIHVAFNNFYDLLFPETSIRILSDKYTSLFVPAGYAFSIWGLIYLCTIIYGVMQLTSSQKTNPVYESLNLPVIIAYVSGLLWGITFRMEMIVLSFIFITIMLIASLVLLVRSHHSSNALNHWYTTVPFSLLSAWLSVATIAAASITLKYSGWAGGDFGEVNWSIIMIFIAGMLGIYVSYKFRNVIFPLVIAWAAIGIWYKRNADYRSIAAMALGVGIILLVWSLGLLVAKVRSQPSRLQQAN